MPENPTSKPQKSQADQSISHLRCSKCLRDDVLHFNSQKYMFECTGCGADFLNPFAIGPWDKRIAVLEKTTDEEIASAYIIHTKETKPLKPNKNYMEFIKTMYAGESLASREIKDDWGLPTQAKKRRRRKKKNESAEPVGVAEAQSTQEV